MIRKIRRTANVGLYGTLLLMGVAVAEYYLANNVWNREIVTNEYTHKLFLTTGLVLAVVNIASILFSLRRQLPRLRQMEEVDKRMKGYLGVVRAVYLSTLAVALVLCAIVVITRENTLIMLMMLQFVTLALAYPNKLRMKADLGLTSNEENDGDE